MKTSGGNMGSWVPQLFYDLIARVTPGFITWVTFLIVYIKTAQTNEPLIIYCIDLVKDSTFWQNSPSILIVISGYALSYITGFILRSIFSFCFYFRGNPTDFEEKYVKDYNKIKFSDEKTGSRLSKLRAEIHMCTVLGTGWVFVYMFYLGKTLVLPLRNNLVLEHFVTLFIFSGLIAALIRNYYRIRDIFYNEIDHYKQYKGISEVVEIVENLNPEENG